MSSVSKGAREFFSSKFNCGLVAALIIIGIAAYAYGGAVQTSGGDGLVISFFYLPTCPHCAEQKPIVEQLGADMPDLIINSYDSSSAEGSALFYRLASEAGMDTNRLAVPTIFVGKHPLVGVHSLDEIKAAIAECIEHCQKGESIEAGSQNVTPGFTDFELPFIGRTDLTSYSIPVLAVVLGLVDGFNPCAMWVLVYLIGLLIGIKDRKKTWLIIGSFLFASGALYFLFMTAWLNAFLLVGYVRPLTIAIGLAAMGGGMLSMKDYIKSKGALQCKVGDEKSHEKTMKRIEDIIKKPISLTIIISIIGLAFIVNSVEFLCSSAIPAVFTQILSLSGLSIMEHYLYILVYVLFFMLDDLIIFSLAAFAVSSSFGEKYAKYCRVIGGLLMIILGVLLVFAPGALR